MATRTHPALIATTLALILGLCACAQRRTQVTTTPKKPPTPEVTPKPAEQPLPKPAPEPAASAYSESTRGKTAILAGFGVYDETGTPISGATVRLSSASAGFSRTVLTDENGSYTFTGVPGAEDYMLMVEMPGFVTEVRPEFEIQPGDNRLYPIPFLLKAASASPRETRRRGVLFTGSVYDQAGTPMSGATVRLISALTGFAQTVLTDDDGVYTFTGVPSGEDYVLAVEMVGFVTEIRRDVWVEEDRLYLIPFLLEKVQPARH